jgi:hypothetical protein
MGTDNIEIAEANVAMTMLLVASWVITFHGEFRPLAIQYPERVIPEIVKYLN